jgi:hypothetical protein
MLTKQKNKYWRTLGVYFNKKSTKYLSKQEKKILYGEDRINLL